MAGQVHFMSARSDYWPRQSALHSHGAPGAPLMARAAGLKLRRQQDEGVPPSNTVNNEPEAPMDDFVGSLRPSTGERVERARGEARERYRGHLAAVFDQHGVDEATILADVALDALTVCTTSTPTNGACAAATPGCPTPICTISGLIACAPTRPPLVAAPSRIGGRDGFRPVRGRVCWEVRAPSGFGSGSIGVVAVECLYGVENSPTGGCDCHRASTLSTL